MINQREAFEAGLELKASKIVESVFEAVFNDEREKADKIVAYYIAGVIAYRHDILRPVLNRMARNGKNHLKG